MSTLSEKSTRITSSIIDSVGTTTHFVTGNVNKYMPTIIISSLTIIAGLSWNSTFDSIINKYVPADTLKTYNAWLKVLYAFTLSIVIIIMISAITYYLPQPKI